MKKLLFIITIFLTSAIWSFGQTEDKPICISREAAESCAVNATKIKALEAEKAALEQAGRDKDAIINDLKVEVARINGQLTANQQTIVLLNTMNQFLLTNGRKKCGGLTLFCIQ